MIRNTSNDKNSSTSILQKVMTLALVAMFVAFMPATALAQTNSTSSGVGITADQVCQDLAGFGDMVLMVMFLILPAIGVIMAILFGTLAQYASVTNKRQTYIKYRNGGIAGAILLAIGRALAPTFMSAFGFNGCLDHLTMLTIQPVMPYAMQLSVAAPF